MDDQLRQLITEMNKHLKTADHLLYVTYPLVKDQKLIIAIIENLHRSLLRAIDSVLYYDKLYKRISVYPDNFNTKFDIFRNNCARRYDIDPYFINLIREVKDIVEEHKKSPMEFIRKEKYVIMSDNFRTRTLTIDKLKKYVNESKPLVRRVNKIYQNELTRRSR